MSSDVKYAYNKSAHQPEVYIVFSTTPLTPNNSKLQLQSDFTVTQLDLLARTRERLRESTGAGGAEVIDDRMCLKEQKVEVKYSRQITAHFYYSVRPGAV